jgi:hypothetical protein
VDKATALDRIDLALATLKANEAKWKRRRDYFDGEQDLPYAPEGVNDEYETLREQSVANWIKLALLAPVQRLRVDGFRTGRDQEADKTAWQDVWQPNKGDLKQRLLYVNMMVHDLGIMAVWPNKARPQSPIMRVESSKRVHLERDPEDPTRVMWSVKTFSMRQSTPSVLWTPKPAPTETQIAVVYDDEEWWRFSRPNNGGVWTFEQKGANPFGESPFVPYSLNEDEDGELHPSIDALMPQQDAINTVRFNTLLAMQFSAFRQRVFTGYDPVVRDNQGKPVYQTHTDGSFKLDGQGQKMPVLNTPGRVGVDRALVFPGKDTKVFDLPESNLKNYIEVLDALLSQFFATGQVPPQYLLTRMANLSGDALAGAESTLQALVQDLQTAAGESHEQVMRLANKARGENAEDLASEVIWADAEARSFSQTVDAIVKLIQVGFPRRAAFEMVPGATLTKVDQWMEQVEAEQSDPTLERLTRTLTDASAFE